MFGFIARPLAVLLMLLPLFSAQSAQGAGFGIFTQDAAALGQANAVISHTSGPASIFFNPALLTRLEGTQATVGTTLILPRRRFTSGMTGAHSETEYALFFPSTLYLSHGINDRITAGIGVFSPFGLGTDWGDTWEGRYIATNSEMTTFAVNPVIAYRITPRVSVAAGVTFLTFDTTLESKVNLSAFGLPDAHKKFRGDGTALGYNLGLLVDFPKDVSVGLSWRSGMKVDVDGRAKFNLPGSTPPVIAAFFPNTKGHADIDLPPQAHAGINYHGFKDLIVEAGLRWEGWSSFRELRIDLDQPVAGSTESITPKKWRDTLSMNLGARYRVNNSLALLAGWLYSKNAVPGNTFEPAIPDADTHLFTVGSEFTFRRFIISLGYGFQLLESRRKGNNVGSESSGGSVTDARANGTYRSDLHLIAMSITYKF